MTHTLGLGTPSRDANALLALTVLLILTTWSFFGRFSLLAATAGIACGLWLHWWNLRHPTLIPTRLGRPPVMLNISSVHIGGDAAGLAWVLGTVVIFVMALPPLRWFVLASGALALVCAAALIAWRRTHAVWSPPEASLRA